MYARAAQFNLKATDRKVGDVGGAVGWVADYLQVANDPGAVRLEVVEIAVARNHKGPIDTVTICEYAT